MKVTLVEYLAQVIDARLRCERDGKTEWFERHTDRIEHLRKCYLPSGSGIDSGCQIDLTKSHLEKIVITTAFHHMDENGYYDGWTDHTITVTPSFLGGFRLRISGVNRNDIKEYLSQVFHDALSQGIDQ